MALLREGARAEAIEVCESFQRFPKTAMSTDDLLTYLFDEQPHLLFQPMAMWLASSMLEVTRVQVDPNNTVDVRLAETIPSKLGQLLIGVEAMDATPGDIHTAMLSIQQRAERNDPAFLQRYAFRDRADFFRHYQRLGEILVRGPHFEGKKSIITWTNPQAKHPLPSKVRTALKRSHTS